MEHFDTILNVVFQTLAACHANNHTSSHYMKLAIHYANTPQTLKWHAAKNKMPPIHIFF